MRKNQLSKQTQGAQVPDIIVHLHRQRTKVYLFASATCALICFAFCAFMIIIIIFASAPLNAATIFIILLLGGLALPNMYAAQMIARLLTSGKPMLVITYQGIRIGKLYGNREIVLLWKEIETISMAHGGIEKGFTIYLRDVTSFISRFSPSTRFFMRHNFINVAPLTIPQSFLEKPIKEILYQIQARYKQDLDYHHINLG